jgi:hypothetical protein
MLTSEIGRIAIFLKEPQRYLQRRIEQVDLVGDRFYQVNVSLQVTIPNHNDREGESPKQLYVPLGSYKKSRLPDVVAVGPDGTRLPILSHRDRTYIIASIFEGIWIRDLSTNLSTQYPEAIDAVLELFDEYLYPIISEPPEPAEIARGALYRRLDQVASAAPVEVRQRVREVFKSPDLTSTLVSFTESAQLLTEMTGVPGRTYIISVQYSEQLPYEWCGKRSLSTSLRAIPAALGMTYTSIIRETANRYYPQSFYAVASLPPGIEPIRYFWNEDSDTPMPLERHRADGQIAVVSCRYDTDAGSVSQIRSQDLDANLDVQIMPSASMIVAIALVIPARSGVRLCISKHRVAP